MNRGGAEDAGGTPEDGSPPDPDSARWFATASDVRRGRS